MNISAKFQLYPYYGFWDDFWTFFSTNLAFWLPWQPIKLSGMDKTDMFDGGLLKEHFCETLSKYLQWHSNKCQFSFSHYKSMATISCHRNQVLIWMRQKMPLFVPPKMLYVKFVKNRLNGFKGDVVWKCWWTDERMPGYTISSHMTLRLRWANNVYWTKQITSNKFFLKYLQNYFAFIYCNIILLLVRHHTSKCKKKCFPLSSVFTNLSLSDRKQHK